MTVFFFMIFFLNIVHSSCINSKHRQRGWWNYESLLSQPCYVANTNLFEEQSSLYVSRSLLVDTPLFMRTEVFVCMPYDMLFYFLMLTQKHTHRNQVSSLRIPQVHCRCPNTVSYSHRLQFLQIFIFVCFTTCSFFTLLYVCLFQLHEQVINRNTLENHPQNAFWRSYSSNS